MPRRPPPVRERSLGTLLKTLPRSVPRLDAELLLAHLLKKPRLFVITHPEHLLPPAHLARWEALVARRAAHEPLAYLVGEKEFYGLPFSVDRHTLIPRPETELLVEHALDWIKSRSSVRPIVLDVGTGSGCIIIALAKLSGNARNKTRWYAGDVERRALRVARRNSRRHRMDRHIRFAHSDLLGNFSDTLENTPGHPLLITANLPYLSPALFRSAERTVRTFEPRNALASRKRGLAHIARLLGQVSKLRRKRSGPITLLLEFSPEQTLLLTHLVKDVFPLNQAIFYRDLTGRKRLLRIDC